MTDVTISAKDVKALRDRTGAGMMDCKKALTETGGDVDAAGEERPEKPAENGEPITNEALVENGVLGAPPTGAREPAQENQDQQTPSEEPQ